MIYFAPLQGYTEAFYRRAHNAIIGGVDEYVTPFLRLEKNELPAKDMSKLGRAMRNPPNTVPQVLVKSPDELKKLLPPIEKAG